ncbi:MAG: aromatic ring-hydroxylating oxygenase subunit alpha [Burkholderiales bacterium]
MSARDLDQFVIDRVADGEFNVHRDLFRDPLLFDLEMRYIFEGTWVFLGLASQAPAAHDYFTTWIGRQPVVVMRDANGDLGAFLNSCRHRGATICPHERGHAKYHVCPYHGWAYDSAGKNLDVRDRKHGQYSPVFDRDSHDLAPIAHFGNYRGFLFGCLNPDAATLDAYLGDTRFFLDLVIDQSPHGVEMVPGSSTYTFNGNWKLQIENCVDVYHVLSAHSSFVKIVERRRSGESGNKLDALDFEAYRSAAITRGSFTFTHGHAAIWAQNANPRIRPLYPLIDEVKQRVGALRAEWMLYSRNLTLYPNVQIAENASLQMRVIRPLAVDKTEMRIYCLAPVGEPDDARAFRIRQYEDFFNVSGLATPDDTTCYEDCQSGYRAHSINWQQGYARGITAVRAGADDYARTIGIAPVTSQHGPHDIQDETIFHASYREWLRLMKAGARRDALGKQR